MRIVTPLDLRRSLGRILDEASAGQRFLIERDHRPLAVLIPLEDAARLDETEDAAQARRVAATDALEAYRGRIAAQLPTDRGHAEDLVREGRDALDHRDRARASRGDAT